MHFKIIHKLGFVVLHNMGHEDELIKLNEDIKYWDAQLYQYLSLFSY